MTARQIMNLVPPDADIRHYIVAYLRREALAAEIKNNADEIA